MRMHDRRVNETINSLCRICHKSSDLAGWWEPPKELLDMINWEEPKTQEQIEAVKKWWGDIQGPTKIALIHSEASEMLEGARKGIKDDHLPERDMDEVEAADILIRLFDYAGRQGWDLGGALMEKFNYNQDREDHKPENRAKEHGKRF